MLDVVGFDRSSQKRIFDFIRGDAVIPAQTFIIPNFV
jgi:hypothetical protein